MTTIAWHGTEYTLLAGGIDGSRLRVDVFYTRKTTRHASKYPCPKYPGGVPRRRAPVYAVVGAGWLAGEASSSGCLRGAPIKTTIACLIGSTADLPNSGGIAQPDLAELQSLQISTVSPV